MDITGMRNFEGIIRMLAAKIHGDSELRMTLDLNIIILNIDAMSAWIDRQWCVRKGHGQPTATMIMTNDKRIGTTKYVTEKAAKWYRHCGDYKHGRF